MKSFVTSCFSGPSEGPAAPLRGGRGLVEEKIIIQGLTPEWGYLGKESFKDRLLKLLENPVARSRTGGAARGDGPARDRGEKEAGRLLAAGTRELGLPGDRKGLEELKKSDARKVKLAALLRARTSVSNEWIAGKLAMGHPGSVSRLVALCRSDRSVAAEVERLAGVLIHED